MPPDARPAGSLAQSDDRDAQSNPATVGILIHEMAKNDDSTRDGELSRRRAMAGVGAILGGAALGCSSEDGADATGNTGGAAGDTGGGAGAAGSSGSNSGGAGGSGGTPEDLLQSVDHFVVLMMENRSFDHYFGSLKLVEGREVDGLDGTESNLDSSGNPYVVSPAISSVTLEDPPHSWNRSHAQWNDGANDGFVTEYEDRGAPDLAEVMRYYVRDQLPVHYAMADNYVVCDRWFSSVMAGTWPNRFYLHLATARGRMSNDAIEKTRSVFDALNDAGVSNKYYFSDLPTPFTYGAGASFPKVETEFFDDAANGTLPSFSMIDPVFGALNMMGRNDDHPPADVNAGQAFIATIHNALAASPQWNKTMLIITYDEHGGFYDHVSPPTTTDELPEFRQLGFRVPTVIAGPMVKQGAIDSTMLDHVSVISTVTKRFGLEPLNTRVEDTNDFSSVIDPEFAQNPRPAAQLPTVTLPPQMRLIAPPGIAVPGQDELARLIDRTAGGPDWRREHVHAATTLRRRALDFGAARLL